MERYSRACARMYPKEIYDPIWDEKIWKENSITECSGIGSDQIAHPVDEFPKLQRHEQYLLSPYLKRPRFAGPFPCVQAAVNCTAGPTDGVIS